MTPRLSPFWFCLRSAFWLFVLNLERNNFPFFAYVRLSWLMLFVMKESYVIADPTHRIPTQAYENEARTGSLLSNTL